ncbi:epoxide hydrolase 4-like [Dendronephthya gigantea]|uniref:epoxide hydrolase 4-like n=1 Tax=Dendronephthya gigantea TaxID=151771 RepID=UPI00106C57C7|nr:epoxide hydrolase 4-like [Dendronephthya gigantea]
MVLFFKRIMAFTFMYSIGIFYGCMVFCRLIWSIIREGTVVVKSVPIEQAPTCLEDKNLGIHNYVTTKSKITFHYVANGDVGQPLMLFLHGFPEFWYSWRYQLKEFCKDYRAVAVDLRGYGFSDKPEKTSLYKINYLAEDVKEIVEALGYTSCTLVGHDWGGLISWSVAHRFPEIVDKLVILNCPHPKIFMNFLLSSWKQFLMCWYIFLYQLPYLPELFISLKKFRIIRAVFRGKYAGVRNTTNISDLDIEAFKFAISQPGALTAALNYYRNVVTMYIDNDWLKDGQPRVTAPTLIVWGDQDAFLLKKSLDFIPECVENSTIRFVGGASHWVQQDEPQIVNDFIREFLESS